MILDSELERTLTIRAQRGTVFRYFTDSSRFAAWWGEGSSIDARPGGRVLIRYPGGTTASGEIVEIDPPTRIVFTYGYEDPGKPVPPGGSRVTITLDEVAGGTRLRLVHAFAEAKVRDMHEPGWRHQLGIFNDVVTREQHEGATAKIDAWFAAWGDTDPARVFGEIATPDVTFTDRYGCTTGLPDLAGHVAASQTHMPGLALARDGDVRHVSGTALVDWCARKTDGSVVARGSNVVDLAPDGRIARVVGFWR